MIYARDVVDNVDDRIRELCRKIAEESDPDEVNELGAELRSVLKQQHDMARLRLQNIALRYGSQMRSAPAPWAPAEESGSRMMALLTFLGLTSRNAA